MPPLVVVVPPGFVPGQQFVVQFKDGNRIGVVVPPGVLPGQRIQVQAPDPQTIKTMRQQQQQQQ